MNQVFYLKYRPLKLADLDLTPVREGLIKIIKSGRIPHALLFAGPRGTGKTSAARIFAKVVNCQKRKKNQVEPCNRCSACLQITAGTALDVIEIDAASNRGIDDIRDLREKIKLAPAKFKAKVYIVDEVHMLTNEAFNALLKTLEEPPENTYFILCTTAPEKLPETILSRCLSFKFRKATVEEVVNCLERVIKGEKISVEKGVLKEIAQSVDGSFRDAQKILDHICAGRKKVTLKEVKKILGRIEKLSPKKLLAFLAKKDLKAALLEIEKIVENGADLGVYLRDLLTSLRDSWLSLIGVKKEKPAKDLKKLTPADFQALISLFSQANVQLKSCPIPQLPLEIAVVEWCLEKGPILESRKNLSVQKKKSMSDSNPSESSPSMDLKKVNDHWPDIKTAIRPLNHSVEALLRAARPLSFKQGVLTLEVFYRFHKERLEEEKCRAIFEEKASEVLAQPVRLRCILGQKNPSRTPPKKNPPASSPKIDESQNDDIIKTAEQIFSN